MTSLSAAIVEDFILYPIHRDLGVVQYAGHVMLWGATATQAFTIAEAMCQRPIIGVEVAVCQRSLGAKDRPVATVGETFADATRPAV